MQRSATERSQSVATGLFKGRDNAERAWRCAAELGCSAEDISVVMTEDTRTRYFPGGSASHTELAEKAQKSNSAIEDAAEHLGGPAGGTAGTVAPVLAALGTLLLVPGLGIAAAGPLAIALTAGGAVGIAGGLMATMMDWGVPKDRIERYEQGVRDGGVFLAAHAPNDEDAAAIARLWRQNGGELVHP